MLRRSMMTVVALGGLLGSVAGYAYEINQFGTAGEARAMLERVVTSMKADPAQTIAQINKGEGGFKDRDLYPFCAGPEGKNVAHPDPTRIGLVQRDLRDIAGNPYGAEFVKVAEEGKIAEVSYLFPRPGPDRTPVPKVTLVTKVSDYICGVGYYQ